MKKAFILILVWTAHYTHAQDFPRKDFQMEKLADEIFPMQDLDLNYQDLYENLALLLADPIDLNLITREQLRSFMMLTEEQINEFLNYRDLNGPLLSVYELQSLHSWSRFSFDKVIPFVIVGDAQATLDASVFSRITHEKNNYLLLRYERTLEPVSGSEATDSAHQYAGNPGKMYVRYHVANSNDFSLGFTAEKDAGEAIKWDPTRRQYGPDYLSFHAQLQNKGRIRNLILGDFQSQFGQGLILGSVFGFGKNSETVATVRRSNLGFLPYTSVNENLFFRGAALSYSLSKNILVHGFISDAYKDGNIQLGNEEETTISSLSNSGLHRTPAELQLRKQVEEKDIGAVFQIKATQLDAGIIFHQVNFNKPIQRSPTPYNQFSFQGITNQDVGAYLNYSWANVTFFSEFSKSLGHGMALSAGVLGNITAALEVSMLLRSFDRDFYTFNPNAFSENTLPQNEKGLYMGYKYSFNKRFSTSGYIDMFQFPWLRYRGYAPSDGSEWLLRFTYTPSRNVVLFVQAREESKSRNLSNDSNLYLMAEGVKRNFWINCDYGNGQGLSFKTRVQCSTYSINGHTTRGLAIVQDVNFSIHRWSISLRHALFDTDDYDNRLYLYERDAWLAYSFPAYYGVGVRNYILLQYAVSRKIDVWVRLSHVQYVNQSEIGTGSETIEGNTKNDVKFQVRIRF